VTLLAGKFYDPAAAVSAATSALLAMTAFDTTNLRLVFAVPANGAVLVRIATQVTGSTTMPHTLLGVLEGATIRGRVSPIGMNPSGVVSTDLQPIEASYVVSGLTAGASLTWDAAYGVESVSASTNIKYGGPNNASGANAFGGFAFEIYDTIPLLASKLYDPGTAATQSIASLLAMTAMDTTNLRVSFQAPKSGKVYWRVRVPWVRAGTTWGQVLLGVLDGSTVRGRVSPQRGLPMSNGSGAVASTDGSGIISGLTGGQTYTWDAAYGVEVAVASQVLEYGGPNDTTTVNAWGGAQFEVWAV
jgi:hypothetical protein